jgi:hypothetical protein
MPRSANLAEDGGRGGAAEAAGRVERIDAEELVDQAAGDTEHRRAAVVALGVELEGLHLRIIVTDPALTADVARSLVECLRLAPVHTAEDRELRLRRVRDCRGKQEGPTGVSAWRKGRPQGAKRRGHTLRLVGFARGEVGVRGTKREARRCGMGGWANALAPVSVMHVTSMIASQPAVGVASSEAKQSVGMSANLRPCDGER